MDDFERTQNMKFLCSGQQTMMFAHIYKTCSKIWKVGLNKIKSLELCFRFENFHHWKRTKSEYCD
eukprot:TRINITY_DN2646_c0_g1_i1.p1 TRINITY_DN2646_c0_g1~~TRINITY_DN2646_c0_g1_i1.p1  ORF type:complete len:65 (+),score=6.53 TRINITY_DN2646_c0_g1_i1:236-430(+)